MTKKIGVVVHCPPRTGSYSLLMLINKTLDTRNIHVHYLVNRYYYWNKSIARSSINRNGKEAYKIVCTIRDPIARNLSEYWRRQQVDANKNVTSRGALKIGLGRRPGTHQERFYAHVDHFRQHHFFGGELIPYWGIDIFEQPFTLPYTIYDDRLLVIRCEDLDGCAVEAVSKLLGVEVTQEIKRLNVVPIRREPIRLNEAYIDAMYDEREFFPRWFYSEDEVRRFKKKWMLSSEVR